MLLIVTLIFMLCYSSKKSNKLKRELEQERTRTTQEILKHGKNKIIYLPQTALREKREPLHAMYVTKSEKYKIDSDKQARHHQQKQAKKNYQALKNMSIETSSTDASVEMNINGKKLGKKDSVKSEVLASSLNTSIWNNDLKISPRNVRLPRPTNIDQVIKV